MNTAIFISTLLPRASLDQEAVFDSIKATTSSIHALMTTVIVVVLLFGTAMVFRHKELELLGVKVQRKFLYPVSCAYLSGAFLVLQMYLTKIVSLLDLCTDLETRRKAVSHLFTDPSPFNIFAFSSIGHEPILSERISSNAIGFFFLVSLLLVTLAFLQTFEIVWPNKWEKLAKMKGRGNELDTVNGIVILAIAAPYVYSLLNLDDSKAQAKIAVARSMASIPEYKSFRLSYGTAILKDQQIFETAGRYVSWIVICLLLVRVTGRVLDDINAAKAGPAPKPTPVEPC